MRAVAGLGNPGPEYERTRHNVGFMVVDELCRRYAGAGSSRRGLMVSAELRVAGARLLVVKPQTYMNRSGVAVRQLVMEDGARGHDLIVVHDDVDLELGTVRVKLGGGHGGHNGLRSILQEEVEAGEFIRVRLGIGRDPQRDTADWVLEPFPPDDGELVEQMVKRGADAVEAVLAHGPGRTMTEYNRRRPSVVAEAG